MTLPIIKYLLRPSVVRRLLATLRYPSQIDPLLPPAEVLSIAVAESARGSGVGKKLMAAAMNEFEKRNINCVKVAVWDSNKGANAFYVNCGFRLASDKMHHGLKMNIYTAGIKNEQH